MFDNYKLAFSHLSDKEVRNSYQIFYFIRNRWVVKTSIFVMHYFGSIFIFFFKNILRKTIFNQFCSGETLEGSLPKIQLLESRKVSSVLVYGVEAQENEEGFKKTTDEIMKMIMFSQKYDSIEFLSIKLTGLFSFDLLEKIQKRMSLSTSDSILFRKGLKRLVMICQEVEKTGTSIFIDAEETWIQGAIDSIVTKFMKKFNRDRATIYNTYQLYLKDALGRLKNDFEMAQTNGYRLGAKLVRGAYMEIERKRANKLNYTFPIQDTIQDTHDAFNNAVKFCLDNYEQIAFCNASHNEDSAQLQVELMTRKNIDSNHPNISFCQLYGMSDHITFKLSQGSFNVCKYMIYGKLREVIPYLIRRAQENSSVKGTLGREFYLIREEYLSRGL